MIKLCIASSKINSWNEWYKRSLHSNVGQIMFMPSALPCYAIYSFCFSKALYQAWKDSCLRSMYYPLVYNSLKLVNNITHKKFIYNPLVFLFLQSSKLVYFEMKYTEIYCKVSFKTPGVYEFFHYCVMNDQKIFRLHKIYKIKLNKAARNISNTFQNISLTFQ